jgi:chromosome segregation ATPase
MAPGTRDFDRNEALVAKLNEEAAKLEQQAMEVQKRIDKLWTDKDRKADEAKAKQEEKAKADALKAARTQVETDKKDLAAMNVELEYLKSEVVDLTGQDEIDVTARIAKLENELIPAQQRVVENIEGALSVADQEAKAAVAAKAEAQALDNAANQIGALYEKIEPLQVKWEAYNAELEGLCAPDTATGVVKDQAACDKKSAEMKKLDDEIKKL